MLSDDVDLLKIIIGKADEWRALGLTADVEIFQMNVRFPNGDAAILKFDPEAIDNGDETFSGDWQIST